MTTRQRSQSTASPATKTLAQLQKLVPYGPAHVTPMGYNGPWQVQTAKVVLATCRHRDVAEYLARLWNTIAPAAEPDFPSPTPAEIAKAIKTIGKHYGPRRKAGKTVQVVP